jgi:tetratricopeptide (TPR) repeat protein
MRVEWEDPAWDVALVGVHDRANSENGAGGGPWQIPTSLSPMVVRLGTTTERDCEAVGFPQAEVQQAASGRPADARRQSEQAVGTLLPVGQGKPAQHPDRALPLRWMPLDVDVSHPDTTAGWQGISSGGVIIPDGRLVGIAVAAESEHEARRLYVVPLADVLSASPELVAALTLLLGRPIPVEARMAPLFRDILQPTCLGDDGLPMFVGEAGLGAFGVKEVQVVGEPTFLDYVPRDDDSELTEALQRARSGRRTLLVVGGSASGKSRSTAQAARIALADHRLVCPQPAFFLRLHELPLDTLGPAVVWLDDAERFDERAFGDVVGRLLRSDLVVIATIRRSELDTRMPQGDLRNSLGEALTDKKLVLEQRWKLDWSDDERARVRDHVTNEALLTWVASGGSPSVWSVAGPELMSKLERAQSDDERPWRYRLMRTVLDWYRTGIGAPIPTTTATGLLATLPGAVPDPDEASDALKWALRAVVGVGRRTSQSLLSEVAGHALRVHDYVQDAVARTASNPVPDAVWDAALDAAANDHQRIEVGFAAALQSNLRWALNAWRPSSERGNSTAIFNMGVLLGQLHRPKEAVAMYDELVARFGDASELALREQVAAALVNKGVILDQLGPPEEGVTIFDKVITRFGEAPELALREQVAAALVNKGVRLYQLGRFDETIGVHEQVVARFGDAPELALREQVARALFNIGVLLDQLGRSEEGVAMYDEVVTRFGEAPELALRKRVAEALVNKGICLGQLGRPEEEVRVYDQVAVRFGDASELALRVQTAGALLAKGVTLGQLGRAHEAVGVCEELVARFGDAPEPALREQCATARAMETRLRLA